MALKGSPVTINGWEPYNISKSKVDIEGNVNAITDQCGYTETRKNGDKNINYTVSGTMFESDLSQFYSIARAAEADVTAVCLASNSGTFKVQDATVENLEDENTGVEAAGGTPETVLGFQFQFREPKSPQ